MASASVDAKTLFTVLLDINTVLQRQCQALGSVFFLRPRLVCDLDAKSLLIGTMTQLHLHEDCLHFPPRPPTMHGGMVGANSRIFRGSNSKSCTIRSTYFVRPHCCAMVAHFGEQAVCGIRVLVRAWSQWLRRSLGSRRQFQRVVRL